ncbi:hypothetical protein BD413DRAFT_513622 [Trametes elegans]|nr:hypothetical protein BD413DRAFT_513622 [Trametes elegans]
MNAPRNTLASAIAVLSTRGPAVRPSVRGAPLALAIACTTSVAFAWTRLTMFVTSCPSAVFDARKLPTAAVASLNIDSSAGVAD